MKNIFIIICGLFFYTFYGQENKVYIFNVELDNFSNAPKFLKKDGVLFYSGTDTNEKTFFSKYKMLDFLQKYPDSHRERTLNIFMVVSYNKDLMDNMIKEFPEKYLNSKDISDSKVEYLNTYPNDYGTTSPVANLGFPANLKSYDYINVPKAWDYTYGDSNILIGISDGGFDTTDTEFSFKTTYTPGYTTGAYTMNSGAWHGTSVTAIAAAQGNNGRGTVGVCSNCGIVQALYTYGNPGTYENPTPDFNRLLQLAIAGVKVINMSWRYSFYTGDQWVIDEIHEDYDVVLIAASGNENPNDLTYKTYPASYNHVISVSGVNHKNNGWNDEIVPNSTYGNISRFVADQIAPSVATNYNGAMISWPSLTINEDVDICAPGFQVFLYSSYVLNPTGIIYTEGATSPAAPHVTGTVGLMYSVNECLKSNEVESVLKLTAKNLERIIGNEPYVGRIGAGKLETGDAVEFVHEMKSSTGNAVIDGQDFYRFNFKLEHINNKLTISNQTFRDICVADFTAKNVIEILPGSDFKPNETGLVDLKINSAIDVSCTITNPSSARKSNDKNEEPTVSSKTQLYPNPNNGTFSIAFNKEITNVIDIEVYDIFGKVIYKNNTKSATYTLSIPNLSSGIYIVKLSSDNYSESLKFIKN